MSDEIKQLQAKLAAAKTVEEQHAILDQLIILYTLQAIARDPHGGRTCL
jgi:hypothetical protein